MSTAWDGMQLKDLCLFLNGLWKGEKPPFVTASVIRNTNFAANGLLDDSDIAVLAVEEKQFLSRRLQYGDIILEKSGGGPKQPVGRVALFDKLSGDFSFSNFTSALRVRESSLLDFRFLHKYLYWLHLSGATSSIQSHSTGIRNLNTNAYKELHIPLPPLPEQQRIVGILDKAFENTAIAKANTEKNIENALELFQSELNAIFEAGGPDWREHSLDRICTLINGRGYSKTDLLRSGKYRVLRVGNFFTNRHWYYSNLELPEEKYCDTGDLLYAWSASFGPRIWEGEKVIFHYHIWKVLPNALLVNKDFLLLLLDWDKENLKAAQGTGTTMMHVTKGSMEARRVQVPPIPEQMRIVERLATLRRQCTELEDTYRARLDAMSALRRSVLHAAFNGEL